MTGEAPAPGAPPEDDSDQAAVKRAELVARIAKMDVPPDPPATDTMLAERRAILEWSSLRASKGWPETTQLMRMTDFIKDKGLFTALVKFTKGRR